MSRTMTIKKVSIMIDERKYITGSSIRLSAISMMRNISGVQHGKSFTICVYSRMAWKSPGEACDIL